jgi:hypothetical protein
MTHLDFRIDHLVAAICAGQPSIRVDDAGAFLSRELLKVRSQAVLVEYPELRGTFFVPMEPDQNAGASHFTYQTEDYAGEANLGASMSNRPNRVDVSRTEATPIQYRHLEDAYGWSIDEIRGAIMAGRPLSQSKAAAARKVIANRHDDCILIGDGTGTYLGLTGLFKLSNTLTHAVVNGASSGTKVWEDKTGEEIVTDALATLNKVMTTTLGVEVPNMLALPLSSYTVAATKKMGVDTTETAMDRILRLGAKLYPGLMVEQSVKLETAGSSSDKRMVAYRRDAAKVARLDSVEFEQAPPIIEGWNTVINCHAKTAGVYTPKPKSLCYADGI